MINLFKQQLQNLQGLLACYRVGRSPSTKLLDDISIISQKLDNGTKLTRVYLSGPITKGNKTTNFCQAMRAQKLLMDSGKYAVLNPMLTMMHPDECNISWEAWLATDLAFIEVCDIVIRLPGESAGGDKETRFAKSIDVPVFFAHEIAELRDAFPTHYTTLTT